MQDGHLIAFESQKLNDVERRYSAHEKEMLAVVHCLQLWRVYLLGTTFTVCIDNVANTYFSTQKKLTTKQALQQQLLSKYDFVWQHKARTNNRVADALSEKHVQGVVAAISSFNTLFLDQVQEQAKADSQYQKLVQQVAEGTVCRYWLSNDLLHAKGDRLYVSCGAA